MGCRENVLVDIICPIYENSNCLCSAQGVDICCKEEILIQKICEIYGRISSLESLKPSREVNKLFTQLVLACIPHSSIDTSKLSERLQEIRGKLIRLCGEAEGHLENHYSSILGTFEKLLDHINLFPYYTNYVKLSLLEYTILSNHIENVPTKIAFIGSGPLPLTSIVLAKYHLTSSCFHNYDIDPLANSLALGLISPDSDLSNRFLFHTSDIMNVGHGLRDYDVVFMDALVGMSKEEKTKVLDRLERYMAPGSILMLRSAHGARSFLYPMIEPSEVCGFEVLSVFHPTDEVINSVILARKHQDPACSSNEGVDYIDVPGKCPEIPAFNPLNHPYMIEELELED